MFPSLEQVLSVLSAALPLLAIIVPYLAALLLHKLPANQQSLLAGFVEKCVAAAEQLKAGEPGDVKKQYAVESVLALCKRFGVNANPVIVGVLVEAAVQQLNASQPQPVFPSSPVPVPVAPAPQSAA